MLECALRCMPGLPSDQHADPKQARERFPGDSIVLLAERDEPDEGAGPRTLGMTAVAPQTEEGVWYTLFTGVDAAHRGAGVARALKAESFLRARRAGARSLVTHNHETNNAIIGLNTSFGMQPAPGYWDLQRPMPKQSPGHDQTPRRLTSKLLEIFATGDSFGNIVHCPDRGSCAGSVAL